MCTQAAAKRRRRQAANGQSQIAANKRPGYHKKSIVKCQQDLAKLLGKQKAFQSRKGAGK